MHTSRFRSVLLVVAAVVVIGGAALVARAAAQTGAASQPAAGAAPTVVMKTSMGEVRIRLFRDKAPISVENFLGYVNKQFYDGTVFHRIIPTFMVQGGGFTADLTKKPTGAPIKLESQNGLKNTRGTVAMARTGDPNSATSQFFINVVDNPMLDYPKPDGNGYAVFGEVVSGMDVVDKIKGVATGTKAGMQDVPLQAVVIESIRVVK
jgi:peptidyl-prolyl cis-trans isomerase A (cyclophilin A)